MAIWQIESGACTGRGFTAIDVDGFCAKYFTYITKIPAAGGPGWTILLDKSATPTTQTFLPAAVNVGTDEITINAHGYYTGETLNLSNSGGGLPAPLGTGTYFVIKTGANTIKLATDLRYAYAGTAVNITNQGTGTHAVILEGPYIIVSNIAAPTINQSCFVIKFGYRTLEAGYMRVQQFLGWDDTNKIPVGLWDGRRVTTVDAGPFAYDFRGGDQGMVIQSRIGTNWNTAGVDTFTGSANFLEASTVLTDLTAPAVAGASVNMQVTDSSAFTAGKFYYIYDLSTVPLVNYVKCTATPDGTHITVLLLSDSFPTGAVIGSYPHRYYTFGTINYLAGVNYFNNNNIYSKIPYCSADPGYVFNDQTPRLIGGGVRSSKETYALSTHAPGDDNFYAVQKVFLCEWYRENVALSTTGMNRAYGTTNNLYLTYNTALARGLDGRTIGGKNYLYFLLDSETFVNGDSATCALELDTESLA